ncbi:Dirigent protein 17 [Cardamine amara subsp. amara]|uniref:Dirigent protein 17 n=1 Tax=Cardamine amara subsp. amara TaxID=228776 RepID=A0ABD0ZSA1_CARAN
MENDGSIKQEAPSLPLRIFEIPGEPAVVINGVPDEPQTDCVIAKDEPISSSTVGSGEWLEGRQVRKFFCGQYYSGKVTKFDKESGWYRVVYEDGDSEDLDWSELEEVLLPLDVTTPLRSVALWIIKYRQTQAQTYGQTPIRQTQNSNKI